MITKVFFSDIRNKFETISVTVFVEISEKTYKCTLISVQLFVKHFVCGLLPTEDRG